MNQDILEATLKAMRPRHDRESSDLDFFQRGVWREIRHRKALRDLDESKDSAAPWWENLGSVFPKLAFAALILSVGMAWATASFAENRFPQNAAIEATKMLDLSIFSLQGKSLADDQLIVSR